MSALSADKFDNLKSPLLGGVDEESLPRWREQRSKRTVSFRVVGIALIITSIGFYSLGTHSRSTKAYSTATQLKSKATTTKCDPYNNQVNHGSLIVSLNITNPALNRYDVPNCQPLDLLTAISGNATVPMDLSFATDKTIMLFGDSIDRDQLDHFCQWVNGTVTMIDSTHPLSPPLPVGEEIPPINRPNFLNGTRTWPDWIATRPYECYVPQVNLRIFSVFHYGFAEPDPVILMHGHYYPPLNINDRFQQIVVPILNKAAELYGSNPNPTLMSITPGLWSLLRESTLDSIERKRRETAGENADDVPRYWDSRSIEHLNKKEEMIKETINLIADTFPKDQTRILYRALHDIKAGHREISKNRVQNLDQAGRRAVASLIYEAEEDDPRGLDSRLGVSEWGSIMRGQERTYHDDIHPLRLPGSWLQGQILMNQLKMIAEA